MPHGKDPFQIDLGDTTRERETLVRFREERQAASVLAPEGFIARQSGYIGKTVARNRIAVFFLFGFCVFGLLFFRSAYLQVGLGESYKNLAEGNRVRLKTIPAERGVMYDRNGTQIVYNVPNFSLAVVPADVPRDADERERVIGEVARFFALTPEYITAALAEKPSFSFEPLILKENLTDEEAILLSVKSVLWNGFFLDVGAKRLYVGSDEGAMSLSHIVGYEGKITAEELEQQENYALADRIGKTGLEYSYEPTLRGEKGKKEVEVDARGREKEVLTETASRSGTSLSLALDIELQKSSERILREYLFRMGKTKGSVVALDPRNGEVLTLVSWPAFDGNIFARGATNEEYAALLNDEAKPLLNRSIIGEYPSGSTFKPVVAAAALEEGIINRVTSFLSTGGLRVGEWWFPDWKEGGHGVANVTRALAESINTFFYILGGGYNDFRGLGVEKITEYAQKFGLGQRLGIDIPGERSGFLPSKEWKEKTKGERWYVGDTYHYAIGQGDVLVTPLQVVSWISVFANGGILYEPHVVRGLLESGSDVMRVREPVVLSQAFISKNTIDVVRSGLRQAVTSGSARRLGDLPVTSAGKTGTAQWAGDEPPHAWFTGFAPYENPEIAIVVLVEEGVEGSGVALSIAHDILQEYFGKRR